MKLSRNGHMSLGLLLAVCILVPLVLFVPELEADRYAFGTLFLDGVLFLAFFSFNRKTDIPVRWYVWWATFLTMPAVLFFFFFAGLVQTIATVRGK